MQKKWEKNQINYCSFPPNQIQCTNKSKNLML